MASSSMLQLVVAGAHMSGLRLNHQLTDLGGHLLRATKTAPVYRCVCVFVCVSIIIISSRGTLTPGITRTMLMPKHALTIKKHAPHQNQKQACTPWAGCGRRSSASLKAALRPRRLRSRSGSCRSTKSGALEHACLCFKEVNVLCATL
jgi:hypothetical protein